MTTELRADALRSALSGEVIVPADTGFDEARTIFNATIDRRPAAIVWPRSTDDVAAAVRWARDGGPADRRPRRRAQRRRPRGRGRRRWSSTCACVAMSSWIPRGGGRRVGGGALWIDVDAATTAHGLAVTGGTFGDTGVGGLTLGGGLGFLMGTGGLTCDNLVRAEVVTARWLGRDGRRGRRPGAALGAARGRRQLRRRDRVRVRAPSGRPAVRRATCRCRSRPRGHALACVAELAAACPTSSRSSRPARRSEDDRRRGEGSPSPAVFSVTVVFQGTPDEAEARDPAAPRAPDRRRHRHGQDLPRGPGHERACSRSGCATTGRAISRASSTPHAIDATVDGDGRDPGAAPSCSSRP